jgi:hypothetical protein
LRADQDLESVKTLRRHLNPEAGFFRELCGCPFPLSVEGVKTAGEAVICRRNPADDGTRTIIL